MTESVSRRFAGSAAGLVVVLGLALAGQGQGTAPGPSATAELLKRQPFDRITLIDGVGLEVEPVSPRPLPPYDPAKEEKDREKERAKAKARAKRGVAGGEPREGPEPEQANEITIHW